MAWAWVGWILHGVPSHISWPVKAITGQSPQEYTYPSVVWYFIHRPQDKAPFSGGFFRLAMNVHFSMLSTRAPISVVGFGPERTISSFTIRNLVVISCLLFK